jgi:pyruvate formate lyase activating enzyme
MNNKALVFNIQHYSLHDGPGIRTTVFLKGCPLRCNWCSNPESQKNKREFFYNSSKCIGKKECINCYNTCNYNAISFDNDDRAIINREKCINCLKCAYSCNSKAISVQGELKTIDEILDVIEKDSYFYSRSEGGITLSGGEPLLYKEFTIDLLKEAKRRRINTAIETCGYSEYSILKECAKYLDTIIFDIKSLNDKKHKIFTGVSNYKILNNFNKLCEDFKSLNKIVRTPVIPGFNDSEEDIKAIVEFLNERENIKYELLPYHKLGLNKYKYLGRKYLMDTSELNEDKFKLLKELSSLK